MNEEVNIKEEFVKNVYNPENDKHILENAYKAKTIFLGFWFKIITFIVAIVGLIIGLGTVVTVISLGSLAPIVTPVAILIAILATLAILLPAATFYLSGTLTSILITVFSKESQSDTISAIITKMMYNGAMSWHYAERELTGEVRYSSWIL